MSNLHMVALFLFGAAVFGLSGTQAQIVPYGSIGSSSSNCACTLEYRPVCGSNGKTYNNACLLRCEQTGYNPVYQVSDGACLTTPGVYGPFGGSGTGPSSTLNFGTPGYPPSAGFGSAQTCAWTCPTTAQPMYGTSTYPGGSSYYTNYNMPSVGGYSGSPATYPIGGDASGYASMAAAMANASPYGATNGVPYGNINSIGQVCDSRGVVHAGDCQYYRALCELEKRGGVMYKVACANNVGLYGNPPFRTGLRSANEPGTTRSPSG